jgi:outer membrane lipoprotein-sorting protein
MKWTRSIHLIPWHGRPAHVFHSLKPYDAKASHLGGPPKPRKGAALVAFFSIAFFAALAVAGGPAPATQPAAPAVDEKLWARMTEIDARAGRITSLAADFEQRKYTALLRKPLVSGGKIRVKGATMRWDTDRPEKSVLLVTDKEARVYYPAQSTLELYTLDQRLGELAASPLPRLAVLKERFSFTEIPAKELDDSVDPAKFLALKLTPTDPALREHVQDVRVLLDIAGAYMIRAELTDADGDRTAIHFLNAKINADVGEMDLKVPAGTKTVRPLEGLENRPDKK